MPTLLSSQQISCSIQTRCFSFSVGNHSASQHRDCSSQTKKTSSPTFTQSLLNLILFVGLLGKIFFFYDGLGRRIQTSYGGNIINYYYDPEVEFLELGNSINGSYFWNLYGPDRSGVYGGAQGIGGLECTYNETSGTTYDHVKNFFGDTIGIYTATAANRYDSVLGGYGAMPGSSVNGNLQPQWRGRYLDPTGFYYMGARYYDPQAGRFISPDPLGHSSSLGLYDYCNGDPVNGLDLDGRCVEKIGAAGSIIASATFGGPGAYIGVNYGTERLGITDTSSYTDQQQFQYNSQVANLTEGTQGALFALAGARAPVNRISYEPMRFEVGMEEPAVISRTITPSPWPDNAGFIEDTIEREFLMPGTTFDRFCFPGGRFVSPTGTPISMRAMRPGTELLPYNNYRVIKPIEVNAGGIMPSFDQRGLGKQYELPVPIRTLEKRGFIENTQNE